MIILLKKPNSNLEELWKEVSRDLMNANILARDEVAALTEEALNYLRSDGH